MASRQELLDSIQTDMKLTKNFFMRIYGYELTWPGFKEEALTKLECAGCSLAREYYQRFVSEYEEAHEKEMKNVAAWYVKQQDKKEVTNNNSRNERKIYKFDGLPQDW